MDLRVPEWLLYTKFADWEYEHEARIFTDLKDRDPQTNLYFAAFNDQLVLREVIAGPLCLASKEELRAATGMTANVTFRKARLAFRSFRVVTNQLGFGN
jgi:hypothetical protein